MPLAHSYRQAGGEVYLHIRSDLVPCIGDQQELVGIVTANRTFFDNFSSADEAAAEYCKIMQPNAKIILLGSSSFEQRIRRVLLENNITFYGWDNKLEKHSLAAEKTEKQQLEFYRTFDYLCSFHQINPVNKHDVKLNPLPEYKSHPYKKSQKPLVGVHCKALWNARSYKHGKELVRLLERAYTVWNFDETPCENLALLTWIIRDSVAVLTVDTFILHLANSLGIPTLNIQGPVWQHPENAPYLLPGTPPTSVPVTNNKIDKDADTLSHTSPEFIASEFTRFVNADDRGEWSAERRFAEYL